MSILRRLFGERDARDELQPLYAAIVGEARQPVWYRDGLVPDTVDGRFDMVAAVLSLVLIRFEAVGDSGRASAALLTELFIADMDSQLRESGVGDVGVGKHVGKMISALGGRLDAYRRTIDSAGFEEAIARNIYRDAPPGGEAAAFVAARLRRMADALAATPVENLLAGKVPRP